MQLLRADQCTGKFRELEEQWQRQCADMGESYEEFAELRMEHARRIANGQVSSDRYAIYVLENEDGSIESLSHINVAALPRTSGNTLRIVWVLLAPKYDYQDITPDTFAYLAAELFAQALRLATGTVDSRMSADHVKVHLTGVGDRNCFSSVTTDLSNSEFVHDVSIRGNWLHMSLNETLAIAS